MTGFQAGIQKFKEQGFEVIGISTDNTPSLGHWAKEVLKAEYPLGSDFSNRKVSELYGTLMKERGISNRATFVIDIDGKITHIEEGSTAIDTTGALNACSRSKGKH
jgi:alkyl hydroperoxide reductase subunit AhpC